MLSHLSRNATWGSCCLHDVQPMLQGILRTLHLKVTGRKSELVGRVRGFLEIDGTGPIPAELLFCLVSNSALHSVLNQEAPYHNHTRDVCCFAYRRLIIHGDMQF